MSLWRALPFRYQVSRYLNAWQRNRPRLIRRRVLDFPAVPSHPHADQFVVLCEASKFTDGLWSAWSWFRFLHSHLRLHLFVDGAISADQRGAFQRLFPGAELTSLPEFLTAHTGRSPGFQSFLDHHLFARKLAILVELQQTGACLYSDCDVLAFQRPAAILQAIERRTPNAYIVDPSARHDKTYADPWMSERAAQLGLRGINDINGGLLWIGRESLDLALMERLLAGWTPEVNAHFAEQTLLGILFAANLATPLPEEDYVVSGQGMHFWENDIACEDLIVRHYVGNVRHRMYVHAYPCIARQAFAGHGKWN